MKPGKLKLRDSLAHTIPYERSFESDWTMTHHLVAGPQHATDSHQLGPPFLVSQTMPSWDDCPAIPLVPQAEDRSLERANDLKCEDTEALLRAPAEAPQASRPRISAVRDYSPLLGAMRIDTFLERF